MKATGLGRIAAVGFSLALALGVPTTAHAVDLLSYKAGIYQNQGRFGEAEQLYKRALEFHERILGASHATVAATLSKLAAVYEQQGRNDEARETYKRVLTILVDVLDPSHPDVVAALGKLAALSPQQDRDRSTALR